MNIQDIELQPSTGSVIAHLQERLREIWDSADRLEALSVLDAIKLCLKADGYQDLQWNESEKAWTI